MELLIRLHLTTHRHCLRTEIVCWEEQALVPSLSSSLLCQGLNQGPFSSCSNSLPLLLRHVQINAFCDLWCCYCCAGPAGRDANPYRVRLQCCDQYSSRLMMLLRQDIPLPCCPLSTRTLAKSDLRIYIEIVKFFCCQYVSRRWGSNSLWFVWKESLSGKSHLSIVCGALSPSSSKHPVALKL